MIKKKICDYLYLVAGILFFISGFILEKNNDDKNNLDRVYLIRNILYRTVSDRTVSAEK